MDGLAASPKPTSSIAVVLNTAPIKAVLARLVAVDISVRPHAAIVTAITHAAIAHPIIGAITIVHIAWIIAIAPLGTRGQEKAQQEPDPGFHRIRGCLRLFYRHGFGSQDA